MITRSQNGHPLFGVTSLVATLAALKALDSTENVPYEEFVVADGSVAGAGQRRFYWHPTSTLTADDLFVVAATGVTTGRYILAPGHQQDIAVAIAFGTADAAVLATLPTGAVFLLGRSYWEVTADWTGGSSSAIGLSSSAGTPVATTKGDVLGGSGGDVAATLVASVGKMPGTIGAKVAAGCLLKAAATLRFDRITSAFTAGTGFAHLVGTFLSNPGA